MSLAFLPLTFQCSFSLVSDSNDFAILHQRRVEARGAPKKCPSGLGHGNAFRKDVLGVPGRQHFIDATG